MKKITRYNYEKRIKELEQENYNLRFYRELAVSIFESIGEHAERGNVNVGCAWLLKQFRRVFR